MNKVYLNDEKLSEQLSKFISYVKHKDNGIETISFDDSRLYLGREENYKYEISLKAKKALSCAEWKESDIGAGKIATLTLEAMKYTGNLVNFNQKTHFANCIKENQKKAEEILFSLYCGSNDAFAFEQVTKFWGRKYDLVAYLFFIKDSTKYLPISSGNFDKSFSLLGVDFKTSGECSWDNYSQFIEIINEIRKVMEEELPLGGSTPRLIDAHSFVWIVHQDGFRNWNPTDTEKEQIENNSKVLKNSITEKRAIKEYTVEYRERNSAVSKGAKERANGICQLCGQKAPFLNTHGEPYLESHHIEWLSQGGKDTLENVVALCPNCHRKMHVLALLDDVESLKSKII